MIGVSEKAEEALRAHHACAESLVCGPVARPSEPHVVFYRLNRKFVDNERSVPEEAGDIIYYTLAIGHHTGVIDCFAATHDCLYADYEELCAMLPEDSTSRYKMEGILRSGEITIQQEDLPKIDADLREVATRLDACAQEDLPASGQRIRVWLSSFLESLDAIKRDRVIYMVGRELS